MVKNYKITVNGMYVGTLQLTTDEIVKLNNSGIVVTEIH
jgi:hypothetical protein